MSGPITYRVRPEKVEAYHWAVDYTVGFDNVINNLWELGKEIAEWCGGRLSRDENPGQEHKTYYWVINVNTAEGGRRLYPGCYIYKDDNGEFWVKQAEQFKDRFEEDV